MSSSRKLHVNCGVRSTVIAHRAHGRRHTGAADAGVSAVAPGWVLKQTPFHNDVESACPSLTICLLSGAVSVRKERVRMN